MVRDVTQGSPNGSDKHLAELADDLFGKLDAADECERNLDKQIAELSNDLEKLSDEREAILTYRTTLSRAIAAAGLRRPGSSGDEEALPFPCSNDRAASNGADSRTQKVMVYDIIRRSNVGMRPGEIVDEFRRLHGKNIRSGVYKQISRLHGDGKITKQGEAWVLAQKNAG